MGADGHTILVRDYFASESPADLISDNGARISGDLATRLASYENPTQFAQAQGSAPAQAIGQVDTLDGEAFATRTDGSRVSLGTGDPIFQGDLLETATGGSVGIVFGDETSFALGPEGRPTIDELVWQPDTNEGSAVFSVVQGAFTFVSGAISKTGIDNMVVNTPVTTIGVRGAAVSSDGINFVLLGETLPDGSAFTGEVTLSNGSGQSITLAVVGASTQILNFNSAPVDTGVLSLQQIATQFTTIAVVPVGAALPIQGAVRQILGLPPAGQDQQSGDDAATDDDAAADDDGHRRCRCG